MATCTGKLPRSRATAVMLALASVAAVIQPKFRAKGNWQACFFWCRVRWV